MHPRGGEGGAREAGEEGAKASPSLIPSSPTHHASNRAAPPPPGTTTARRSLSLRVESTATEVDSWCRRTLNRPRRSSLWRTHVSSSSALDAAPSLDGACGRWSRGGPHRRNTPPRRPRPQILRLRIGRAVAAIGGRRGGGQHQWQMKGEGRGGGREGEGALAADGEEWGWWRPGGARFLPLLFALHLLESRYFASRRQLMCTMQNALCLSHFALSCLSQSKP
jgi:hypothetical protein